MLSAVSFSETATQTDWSGGDGVPGPVTDWGNSFDSSTDISFTVAALKLHSEILSNPVEHSVDASFTRARSVYAADVDGDGDMDVLGASSTLDDIIWWENTDGTGTAFAKHTVDGDFDGAWSVYAADVDGDGDIDVLGAGVYGDAISWWENMGGTGTAWTEHIVDEYFEGALSVSAADVDGDGDMDVLGAAVSANNITWWENIDGTGTAFVKHTVDGYFEGASSVYAADVDGDGDMDVLGAGTLAYEITWWENTDGTGTAWIKHNIEGNYNHASSVYAADMDGDGDMDVLGTASAIDDISWFENTDGTGTAWIKHKVANFTGAWSVYAADMDGDGDMDMLGAAKNAWRINWWENMDGAGTDWTAYYLVRSFDYPSSVCAADMDSDGDMDVLGAAYIQNEIRWWEVADYHDQGVLESSILDVGSVSSWELFTSNSQIPSGTSLAYQFRSSTNAASMGAWSDIVYSTSTALSGILASDTPYLQYRVLFESSTGARTPVLEDVNFTYNTVSIEENTSAEVTSWSLLPASNPSYGHFAALITVPEPRMVQIAVFDAAGRMIAETSEEFAIGSYSIFFDNLAEGVYFCVMNAGDFTATEQVVVLK